MPSILRLHAARRDDIGDLSTRRPLPGAGLPQLDPFLFLNHHGPQVYPLNNGGLPFGPHPHRGFETVTFILDGELAHSDSGGHESVIGAGGVQWMTAGSGLVHAELSPESFKRAGGPLEILQLWLNLPGRLKMVAPAYVGVQGDAVPEVPVGSGARMRLVSGEVDGVRGAIASRTDAMLATVAIDAGGEALLHLPAGRQPFFYTVRGEVTLNGAGVPAWTLAELDRDGGTLRVGSDEGALLLFGHAQVIGEPVVSYGPFVMNTQAEIRQAIADYQAGRMNGAAG
mgnify:CR=1 FL=1